MKLPEVSVHGDSLPNRAFLEAHGYVVALVNWKANYSRATPKKFPLVGVIVIIVLRSSINHGAMQPAVVENTLTTRSASDYEKVAWRGLALQKEGIL